jgi:hypothetical protein
VEVGWRSEASLDVLTLKVGFQLQFWLTWGGFQIFIVSVHLLWKDTCSCSLVLFWAHFCWDLSHFKLGWSWKFDLWDVRELEIIWKVDRRHLGLQIYGMSCFNRYISCLSSLSLFLFNFLFKISYRGSLDMLLNLVVSSMILNRYPVPTFPPLLLLWEK